MADLPQITVSQSLERNAAVVTILVPFNLISATGSDVLEEAIRALRIEQTRRK